MTTCKECLHYEACKDWSIDCFGSDTRFPYSVEKGDDLCEYFKDKSRFVELPCNIGDNLYQIYWDYRVDECKVSAITIKADKSIKIRLTSGINKSVFEITLDKIGKIIFFAREEAEAVLAKRR